MQRHPHGKDEWGRYGQLRLGKVTAASGPPAFHPHKLTFTHILTLKIASIFPKVQREDRGCIHSKLRQKNVGHLLSNATL